MGPDPVDTALVHRANGGDRAAFAALYERHREFVHAVAWRLTGDLDLAAEVTQETFLWWLSRFPGFALRAKATTFLYAVTRSIATDLARARGRAPISLNDEESLQTPDPKTDQRRAQDVDLAAAIATLPAGQREVMILRYVHDLDLAEIAEALDVPLGTVKSRLHGAGRTLKRAVGSGEWGEE